MVVDIKELREIGGNLYKVRVKQTIDFASKITNKVISSIRDTDIPYSIVGDSFVVRITDLGKFHDEIRSEYGDDCNFMCQLYK